MLSIGKMRLFRRRPSISESQPLSLESKGQDGKNDESKSSNESQRANDYQTVKAVPAVIVSADAESQSKSYKKGSIETKRN